MLLCFGVRFKVKVHLNEPASLDDGLHRIRNRPNECDVLNTQEDIDYADQVREALTNGKHEFPQLGKHLNLIRRSPGATIPPSANQTPDTLTIRMWMAINCALFIKLNA